MSYTLSKPHEVAGQLLALLNNRGVGHTTTMMRGVNNVDVPVIVIGLNQYHSNDLRLGRGWCLGGTHPASIDNLGAVAGVKAAVAIDNAALVQLLTGMLDAYAKSLREAAAAEAKAEGLKEGMRDLGQACKMNKDLLEAMIKGCADEGSLSGRIR